MLSTAIVNINENSLLSSSSLATVSKLRLAIGHRVVPIGTSLVAPRANSSFFRKRPSSSSCWGAKRDRGGFLPPHHPGQSLDPGGSVSVPKGGLLDGSAFFTGL